MNRRLGGLAASAAVLSAAACRGPLDLRVTSQDLPANGTATRELVAIGGCGKVRIEVVEGRDLVDTYIAAAGRLVVRAGVRPGRVRIRATDDLHHAEAALTLHPDPIDADGDGFPDAAELTSADSRAVFRERLVANARSQVAGAETGWEPAQRDCAGLARFAYRQALRETPSAWVQSQAHVHGLSAWGRLPIAFPSLPFLGERAFRLHPGTFDPSDNSAFGPFADGHHLLFFNTEFQGEDEAAAEPGDLLFFYHPDRRDQPHHVMIYFRERGEGRVVYHTGAVDGGPGRLKEISLRRLARHPDPTWHPRSSNEHFLGFHRFKILG